MIVQTATVTAESVEFRVVLSKMDLLKSPGEADMAIESLQESFAGGPVILMAQNEQGSPIYYGDQELVRHMKEISVEDLPWKECSVG